jgi:predicted site-specific integrase-resolvase
LLRKRSVTTILVEHRDRFCRFGAEYVVTPMDVTRHLTQK